MTAMTLDRPAAGVAELQLATFYVGELLLGVEIHHVQEINRQTEFTPVPGAPSQVRGVINLRGEVATVIDLATVLSVQSIGDSREARNLIIRHHGESIGLCVDSVSDIVTVQADELSPPPANVQGVDGRFIRGVHTLESEIVVLLDIENVLCEQR